MLVIQELARRVSGRALFEALSFRVEPGSVLGISGPSGSGKTTLLRALAGLDRLDAGSVSLDGRSQAEWGLPAWRRRVAYVAQQPVVFPGTPSTLLAEVAAYRSEAPGSLDARDFTEAWGLGRPLWDQRWDELSGGERQRFALAIVLAGDPPVLLLDEPTSALDEAATAAVEQSLRSRTCIWVSHDRAQLQRVATDRLRLGGPR